MLRKINKVVKEAWHKSPQLTLTDRVPEEKVSFSIDNENEGSDTGTKDQISVIEHQEEATPDLFYQTKDKSNSHIMIKDVNDMSSNLYDSRLQDESSMSKAYNSWFANSSNTTAKKKVHLSKDQISNIGSPMLPDSYDKSYESKPFSPFQSSESTLKRHQYKQYASTGGNAANVPLLNLDNLERPNFHEEFMETWKEF